MLQRDISGFHQRPQEYEEEDYEEYDEEASEPDEEEEHEASKSTKEEQDFLKLREQLKDRIRQKLKKQSAGALGRLSQAQDRRRTVTNDTFGSFFGPSQPSIATRVIEESRSIRETKHIMANVSSSLINKKDHTSSGTRTSLNHQNHQRPKIVNQIKNKAQTLKDMRDYSFLLSDDTDIPTNAKEQPKPRSTSSAASDGRLVQASLKSKISAGQPARLVSTGHDLKKPASSNQQIPNKVGHVKEPTFNRPNPPSNDSRKIFSDVRNGPGRTTGHIAWKDKGPNQSMVTNKPPRNITNDPSMKRNLPSAKTHSSAQNHYPEKKRLPPGMDRVKTTMKQPVSSSKAEPSKQNSSRGIHNDRLNKRPAKRKPSDEDVDDYRRAIREMFGYNPNKYAGMDDDDSDMEVGFDVIQKEERISSKIAREEDEEQLRLIEEEEERERRMTMKKKLKRS